MSNTLLYRATIDRRTGRVEVTEGAELGPGVVLVAIPADMSFADFMAINKEIVLRFQRNGPSLTRRRL